MRMYGDPQAQRLFAGFAFRVKDRGPHRRGGRQTNCRDGNPRYTACCTPPLPATSSTTRFRARLRLLKSDTATPDPKPAIDALLLKIRGVEAGDMSGMPAYFVNKKMFACIHGGGLAIRVPVATATELQFSRSDVVPFQPHGKQSSREWIQINRESAADYEKDLELLQASIEFVKAAKAPGR